ncbi:MAG: hypothetical protein ACXWEY_04735 [Bacteroidia bacterium]
MKADDKFAKGFENFTEFVFWLQLAASPILTSIVIGGLVSASIDGIQGYVLWGIIVLIGIIGGVVLAEFARKRKGGTAHYASRVMAIVKTLIISILKNHLKSLIRIRLLGIPGQARNDGY